MRFPFTRARLAVASLVTAALAATGMGALATTASALPAPTITAVNAVADNITGITAKFAGVVVGTGTTIPNADIPTASTNSLLSFGATDSLGRPITWTKVADSSVPALSTTDSVSPAGIVTATSTAFSTSAVIAVEATDGTAVAYATVSSTATPGATPPSSTTLILTLTSDTVALHAPVNAGGTATFGTSPTGVAETLSGLIPADSTFDGTNGILGAGSAVPNTYHHLLVTATDAGGAKATETFNAIVAPGVTPPPVGHPYVLNGKWTARTANTASVSWDESTTGDWEQATSEGGQKCEIVYITGYGFGPLGDFHHAHEGFTCDGNTGHNTGYLWGLSPYHTYALEIVPATGTWGDRHVIPGAPVGYVDVFTLADFH